MPPHFSSKSVGLGAIQLSRCYSSQAVRIRVRPPSAPKHVPNETVEHEATSLASANEDVIASAVDQDGSATATSSDLDAPSSSNASNVIATRKRTSSKKISASTSSTAAAALDIQTRRSPKAEEWLQEISTSSNQPTLSDLIKFRPSPRQIVPTSAGYPDVYASTQASLMKSFNRTQLRVLTNEMGLKVKGKGKDSQANKVQLVSVIMGKKWGMIHPLEVEKKKKEQAAVDERSAFLLPWSMR
jgi:hypothetical protein